jgi:hypothetical protein
MRRQSVVFGVLVALHMAWTPTSWAQGEFATHLGDVDTLACFEAQQAVQDEVGDEANPPYRNHGQYVSAATHAANVALTAGEITRACHGCIVSQFARSIPIANQESCGPGLCEVSGGPGWENVIRPGGNGVFTSDVTPQACCQSCAADASCAQWAFSNDSCQHNVGVTCVGSLTPFSEGGIIMCPVP